MKNMKNERAFIVVFVVIAPAVLMHTIEDAIPNFLVFDKKIIEFNGLGDILFNPLRGILPLLTLLAFGLWLRKKRIDRDNYLDNFVTQ